MRLLALALFCAPIYSSLFASGVSIKLSGNQDPTCGADLICITSTSFPLTTNDSGGAYSQYVNEQGGPITALNFDLDYVDASCPSGTPAPVNLSFDGTFFAYTSQGLNVASSSKCTSMQTSGGLAEAEYLLTLTFAPGIPDSFLFQIDLNSDPNSTDPNAPGGWVPDTTFTVTTTTPEPGSILLLAGGMSLLAGLGAKRSRDRRNLTSAG